MKNKTLLRLSFAVLCFLIFFIQGCEESSFGEDLQVPKMPMSIDYPEILNSREFSYIESATPFLDANGHSVIFEIVSGRKGDQPLDNTYMKFVSVVNSNFIETEEVIYTSKKVPQLYIVYFKCVWTVERRPYNGRPNPP